MDRKMAQGKVKEGPGAQGGIKTQAPGRQLAPDLAKDLDGGKAKIDKRKQRENKMISTKEVNADDRPKSRKLNIVTTKTINASLPTIPKKDWKKNTNKLISTHNMEDVAAIAEKKKTLEIVAHQKEYQKKLDAQKRMATARAAKGKK